MIVVIDSGRSFKGAAAYYLHDKRQPGEAERTTAERVAWAETLNLPTADPDRAWRMMAHTAMSADALKQASGQKATGRKLAKPVSTLVLSWKEGEAPTREDQLAAAREVLKVLDVDDRQALIVAHRDTKHPHLHILINRVSHETGIAAPLSNSQKKLQAWALAYEKARGPTLCPKREEKAEARARGEDVEATKRVSREAHEAKQAAANNLRAKFIRTEQRQRDAALAERGRKMHEAHRRQWDTLREVYAERKASLYRAGEARRKAVAAAVKDAMRPEWAALFKRQRDEERRFGFREFTFLGRMMNIADSIRAAGWQDGTARQILGAVFNLASGQRMQAFRQQQEQERKDLSRLVQASTSKAVAAVRKETRSDLDQLRADHLGMCESLRTQQAAERDQLKTAWRERNQERRDAFAELGMREPSAWGREEGRDRDSGRTPEQGPVRERTREIRPGYGMG